MSTTDWAGCGFGGQPEGRRCGIHGDPTDAGRCAHCDGLLAEGETVTTAYDLPGTDPILALGITSLGGLLFGTRSMRGAEARWAGRIVGTVASLQETLEHVRADLAVLDRQAHPSTLRALLRKQLRLQHAATLADLETIFHGVSRNVLIGELKLMRDDGEVRFQGARYVWQTS